MRLNVFTISYNSSPWIACIYAELVRLTDVSWRWTVVDGAAKNVKDTSWCAHQKPGNSTDESMAFLAAVSRHPRITVLKKSSWEGKVEMCNAALNTFSEPGVVLQQDGDELWTCDQLRTLVHLFEDDSTLGSACFKCRYFVGPNIVCTDEGDWWRAWRFAPGDQFKTHEPPVMATVRGRSEGREGTKALGLVFDHQSWTLPKHVSYKEAFYGKRYAGALAGWERAQGNEAFPAKARKFFPWMNPAVEIDRVFLPGQ